MFYISYANRFKVKPNGRKPKMLQNGRVHYQHL